MVKTARRAEQLAKMNPTNETIDDIVLGFGALTHSFQPKMSATGETR